MPKPEDVLRETAAQRESIKMDYTIADAVGDARVLRIQPENLLSGDGARKIIDTLLSALEQSPCYLKAVMTGHQSFTIVDWDRTGPEILLKWSELAAAHGCRPDKVEEVRRRANAWAAQDQMQTKWPD